MVSVCLNKVLDQYDELKLHFQLAEDKDRNYSMDILFQMYSDLKNTNPYTLFQELIMFYLYLCKN